MARPDSSPFEEDDEARPVLAPLTGWEVALNSVSQLAVVVALSLALILILGARLGQPV